MYLTLTEKDDIIQYINFLEEEGTLTDKMGEVVLDNELTKKFTAYCAGVPSSNSTIRFTQKTWTEQDSQILEMGISEGKSLPILMEELGRVEGSVKSRANKFHRKGYNKSSNTWYDLRT